MKKGYINMTKEELLKEKKHNETIMNIFMDTFVIGAFVFLNGAFVVPVCTCSILLTTVTVILGLLIDIVSFKMGYKNFYESLLINYQLNNIVTLDYEKKRYKLDKILEKDMANNKNEIYSIDKKIELLKEHKRQLNEIGINEKDGKIDKELEVMKLTKVIRKL